MQFHFSKEQLSSFTGNIHKEWAITNGIGSYAGSSVIGAHNRTHQGYLIASLHPPVERYLVFSKTNESFRQDGVLYDLETSQHAGEEISRPVVTEDEVPEAYRAEDTVSVASGFSPRKPVYREGNRFQTGFTYDGTVTFTYEAGSLQVEKQLTLVQGENTAAIAYRITNTGAEAEFCITPLMNFREHNASSTQESLQFTTVPMTDPGTDDSCGFVLTPAGWEEKLFISLASSAGTLRPRKQRFDVDMQLQTEVDNEVPGLDCHYTPYDIVFAVPAHGAMQVSLVCHVGVPGTDQPTPVQADSAFAMIRAQKAFLDGLVAKAGYGDDDFANTLVLASNQFLSYRSSTGLMTVLAGLPWFTDWGRDTMIAFTGLTLATGRFDEAKEILLTFSKYVHHGMVPNMFPDNGQEPLYNTADASLWYFYAVYQYLGYVGTKEAYDFIQRDIYPALKEICHAYQSGTDFSIYMDTDGLIHAGSGVDQVTWMDVRVGDWVVTPRHGKPVEINALWYNALCVMEELSDRFGEDPAPYRTLAAQVKDSFCRQFWNEEQGCLYDVVDGSEKDASLRPNQIYAVSLPFTMLSEEQARSVVAVVQEKLYAGCGLRSLSPDHPDYHPVYCGSLPKRDAAYHQGTAWGFLMGGFISAYTKVHHHSPESIEQALAFLAPIRDHFTEGCIGSISEIFDGDAPHTCRGCYAQAWSVGEVLRCYREDILPYQEK
jgi:glycogen debranching enzyme